MPGVKATLERVAKCRRGRCGRGDVTVECGRCAECHRGAVAACAIGGAAMTHTGVIRGSDCNRGAPAGFAGRIGTGRLHDGREPGIGGELPITVEVGISHAQPGKGIAGQGDGWPKNARGRIGRAGDGGRHHASR